MIAGGAKRVQPVAATSRAKCLMSTFVAKYTSTKSQPASNNEYNKQQRYRRLTLLIFWVGAKLVALKTQLDKGVIVLSPVYAAAETFVNVGKHYTSFDEFSDAFIMSQLLFKLLDEWTDTGFYQQLKDVEYNYTHEANHSAQRHPDEQFVQKIQRQRQEHSLDRRLVSKPWQFLHSTMISDWNIRRCRTVLPLLLDPQCKFQILRQVLGLLTSRRVAICKSVELPAKLLPAGLDDGLED